MSRLSRVLPLFLSLSLLAACGGTRGGPALVHQDAPGVAAPLSPVQVSDPPPSQPAPPPEETADLLCLDYDLGEETYGDMPYRLRGRLSLPAEGTGLPLVLLLHGAHDAKDPEAGFYRGFTYLADALARRGYAAASLDIQPAYVQRYGGESDDKKACAMALRQLEFFDRAVRGEALFPVDLTGRLDLGRIVVAGHSRGGDTALELANRLDGAVGAVGIAPGVRQAEKEWRDIPVALLISELDGDIVDLDGYAYLGPLYQAQRRSPAAATLLRGANHNFYNAGLDTDDAQGAPGLLPAEDQRAFLCRYLADFCDYATKGRDASGLFDPARPAPTELYGQRVDSLLVSPRLTLLSDSAQAAPALGCASERVTVDTHTTDLRIPLAWGTEQTLTLWRFQGQSRGDVAQLPLGAAGLDGIDGLALDVAVPPELREPQRLLLAVEDDAGRAAAVRLPALEPAAEGAAYTTFGQVRIPLSSFAGVDTEHLVRAALLPAEDGRWGVLVAGVYGYR